VSAEALNQGRICVVCGRAGSQRLPGKNVLKVGGVTLVERAIRQARESALFSAIVATSDAQSFLALSAAAGAHILVERPPELAHSGISKLPAIQHAVLAAEMKNGGKYSTIVDLDVTCPLRDVQDIRGAVALLETARVGSVITGCRARRVPHFNLVELAAAKPLGEPPRYYDLNAAVLVWERDRFMEDPVELYGDTRIFEMPPSRSWDIDTPDDLSYVEFLLSKQISG